MRICLVTEFFSSGEGGLRGGVEARAFHVSRLLAERHEVTVLTSRERGQPEREEVLGFEVRRVGRERGYAHRWDLGGRLGFLEGGRRVEEEFDLVDGYSFVAYPLAWRLSRRLGVPAVATYHDVWLGEWVRNVGPGGVLGELLERYVLTRGWERFIAVSGYTRGKLVRAGVEGGRVEVVPSGIDLPFFRRVRARKAGEPTVCCVSRLVRYKRVEDLLRALALVREEVPDVRCRIVGTGEEEGNLRRLARELGLEGAVEFLGFLPTQRQVVEVMKSSHLFCLPSTVEGLGLALVEAMACGLPFVASRLPPLLEVSGGKGGLFFTPGDHRELAEKLSLLLSDRSLRERLIREGRRRAEEYDWRVLVRRIEGIYLEVAG